MTPTYRWWRWNVGDKSATDVPGQPFSVPGGLKHIVDGKTYVTNASADYKYTTFVELDPSGTLREAMTVKGDPYGLLRVR